MTWKYKGRIKEYNREYQKKWTLKNSERLVEVKYKYRNSEKGFLTAAISSIFSPSKIKQRGYKPECSKEEIKKYFNEYVKQHGRNCYYCKEPWTYIRKKYRPGYGRSYEKTIQNAKNFSLDRFDNSKTYSIDNIIFCCTECNSSKNKISIKMIKRLYEIINERNL